jgi:hypothetical protein
VTVVRLPLAIQTEEEKNHDPPITPTYRWSCVEHALELIYKDVESKMQTNGGDGGANYRSVINLSLGINVPLPHQWGPGDDFSEMGEIPQDSMDPYFHTYEWLQNLGHLGVVVASANGAADPKVPQSEVLRNIPTVWRGRASDPETDEDMTMIVSCSFQRCRLTSVLQV